MDKGSVNTLGYQECGSNNLTAPKVTNEARDMLCTFILAVFNLLVTKVNITFLLSQCISPGNKIIGCQVN